MFSLDAWLPYRYSPKTRGIQWCVPSGSATEPFFDDYVARCRQRQTASGSEIPPATSLEQLLEAARNSSTTATEPAAFIFHLSRCGSTLLSGCLAALDSCSVLSESALLTEILLDKTLADADKRQVLPWLLHWQGRAYPGAERGARRLIVKWNAWDLFFWPLLRDLYPAVPVIVLVRDPVEILASHKNLCGRHMSGDPSLAHVHPVFQGMHPGETLLDFRIRVLEQLLRSAQAVALHPQVVTVDYAELRLANVLALGRHCGVKLTPDCEERVHQRMQVHSKNPEVLFSDDRSRKQNAFSAAEKVRIDAQLGPHYRAMTSVLPMLAGR